ncbi:MAG: YdiU family protein, partial [Bacteroidota bacterium]
MLNLSTKKYQNEFVENFRGDETGSTLPRQTPGMFFSTAMPTPVAQPKLLAWSEELAEELKALFPNEEDIKILGGNLVTPTMKPYAACYGGHQFGNWAGQLGDGRAITLAEWEADKKTWELQLKGAGPTAYSRRADGRAVLRSSVREYLMSEAMFYLGVPTTRALSLVATGDQVMRDMFYDGHPAYEPGAIVMRVAPTFLRFGNFEILAARNETENLKKLVEWTIEKHYPHITGDDRIINWFREVVERNATLMVEWMRVGFVHGVMNTDNMSILGVTIDYGPYSFVDDYHLNFTPNTTDLPGRRYAFGKQPAVAKWNLGCLAGALSPLFPDTKELIAVLDEYDGFYWQKYYSMMGRKLGLDVVEQPERVLISELEQMLETIHPDVTIFYQLLIDLPAQAKSKEKILVYFNSCFYSELLEVQKEQFYAFSKNYLKRRSSNSITEDGAIKMMQAANPRFILRNYLLHQAIEELETGEKNLFTCFCFLAVGLNDLDICK